MKLFALRPAALVGDVIRSDAPIVLILAEDDLQEICAALVKAGQRRLAEKIADLLHEESER